MKRLIIFMAVISLFILTACTPTESPKAPIPDSAFGPTIPEKGYLVEELGDGLYLVTEGTYHVMFLTTGEGGLLLLMLHQVLEKTY